MSRDARAHPSLEDLCRNLWREPLFHFSLASKELFHSNFLAWLSERWPQQAATIFKAVLHSNSERRAGLPERERRHLDLVLNFEGHEPLIIENKVFSIPRLKQLLDYTESIVRVGSLSAATRCVLSPVAPDWLSSAPGWVHLGYADLIDQLEELAPSLADATSYERATIDNYVRMMRFILDLIGEATRDLEQQSFQLPSALQDELEKVRLADGCGKLRADAVRARVEGRLAREGLVKGFIIESGLTRKKPLLEVFYAASDDVDIGWQLQETQWRLALRTRNKDAHRNVSERIRLAEANSEWFDFRLLIEVVGRDLATPAERPELGPWKKFDPDFIYQYRRVLGIPIEQVLEAGVRYAERAASFKVR